MARGANALLALGYESTYGEAAASAVYLPFLRSTLGGTADLVEDESLGGGRDARDPEQDALDVRGDIIVPHDTRYIGHHLKALLGAPMTTPTVAASLVLTLSALPAVGATLTLNGTAWTIVASGATGNQLNQGANVAAFLSAAATALNASSETQTTKCGYTATSTTLTILNETLGHGGNAFTVAASANFNASFPDTDGKPVISGTLLGGANTHVFSSGAASLPSETLEFQHPEIPSYTGHPGTLYNMLKLDVARKGLSQVGLTLIAQNDVPSGASILGTPTAAVPWKVFANRSAGVRLDDVLLADITQLGLEMSNNLDVDDVIREDGLIGGAEPAKFTAKISPTLKFKSRALLNKATAGTPVSLSVTLSRSASEKIVYKFPRVFLPRKPREIPGGGSIFISFDGVASKDPTTGKAVIIELTNGVSGY